MTESTITSPQFGPIIRGDDSTCGPCGLCGKHVDRPVVGVVVDPSALGDLACRDCANKHQPGLWELTEGLDQIDAALSIADPADRPTLVTVALNVLVGLNRAYEAQEARL